MRPFRFIICFCILGHIAFGKGSSFESSLPRTNLLVYHEAGGRMATVKTKSDWQKRRLEILENMQRIMGPLPGKEKRSALDVKISENIDCGSYVRQFLTYVSEPGSRTPAYLLIPKVDFHVRRKLPAILALHPTDAEFGHRVLVEQLRGNYRAYARDLVERGYVVLAPAYPLMADYQPSLKSLGYSSGTMKAIWDNIRGLDLLESLSYVKHGKIGAIGHSLGGHNAIYTAVFDSRIKVIITSCGFDSFADYHDGNIAGWTSERYMPRLLDYAKQLEDVPFDFHELLGALAPRPVFINAPLHDTNFKWRSVDKTIEAAEPVYRLYHAVKRVHVEHPDCGHDFPAEIRTSAYGFLDKVLK